MTGTVGEVIAWLTLAFSAFGLVILPMFIAIIRLNTKLTRVEDKEERNRDDILEIKTILRERDRESS
jgi:hypothetical protein